MEFEGLMVVFHLICINIVYKKSFSVSLLVSTIVYLIGKDFPAGILKKFTFFSVSE